MNFIFWFALLISAQARPISATIVDEYLPDRDAIHPKGDLLVTFSDFHKEKWMNDGRALIPHVAKTGLVGWVVSHGRTYRDMPFDDTLRIRWQDGHQRDFQSGEVFIEAWAFIDDDKAVAIKSRELHGPAEYDKYELITGRNVGFARGQPLNELPDWAQPLGL